MTHNTKKLLRLLDLGVIVYGSSYDKNDDFVVQVGKLHKGAKCLKCKKYSSRRHQKGKKRKILHHPDVGGRKVYIKYI